GQIRSLRNQSDLTPPFARTQRYFNSFIPQTCRHWNNIPFSLKNVYSVESFKYNYKKMFFPKRILGSEVGDRKLNIFHTRFRLGFTTLNHDLFIRSIKESPYCRCGQVSETYRHYFLECTQYNDERDILLHDLNVNYGLDLNDTDTTSFLNILIYGFDSVDKMKYNVNLFLSVQNYILGTGRFV
ncbi:MAG: hypothetical protein MJA29_03195, partial [Candidatus Omnitrophica bacterium]|nr:hypothetical protein [Candidatus Omnitrophota bacterium]